MNKAAAKIRRHRRLLKEYGVRVPKRLESGQLVKVMFGKGRYKAMVVTPVPMRSGGVYPTVVVKFLEGPFAGKLSTVFETHPSSKTRVLRLVRNGRRKNKKAS